MKLIFAFTVLILSLGARAEDCRMDASVWVDADMRRQSLNLLGDSMAHLLSETELSAETKKQLTALIEAPYGPENDAASRALVGANLAQLGNRRQDVGALTQLLRSPHSPHYMALDMSPVDLERVERDATETEFRLMTKVIYAHMPADLAQDMLLLQIGTVLYLKYKEEKLMDAVSIVALDRARMSTLTVTEGAPVHNDGDMVVVLDRNDLDAVKSLLLDLCNKARPNFNPRVKRRNIPARASATPPPAAAPDSSGDAAPVTQAKPSPDAPAPASAPAPAAPAVVPSVAPVVALPAPTPKPAPIVRASPPPAPVVRPIARAYPWRANHGYRHVRPSMALRAPQRHQARNQCPYGHKISRYTYPGGRRVEHWYCQ